MLGSLITPSRVKLNLESTEWDECFSELLEVMIENNPKIIRTQAISALVQREEKMSTAVFPSVAVPHATCNSVKETQIVLGISSRGVDFEDLISAGHEGLLLAVDKYDYKMGLTFSNYAIWWIRQTITRSIANESKIIRIPVHAYEY